MTIVDHRRTVLIIEDEATVRQIFRVVLLRENYDVLESEGAPQALEVARAFGGTIDLIIVDHAIRDVMGRQVVEDIRKSRPEVKILHVSGYPQEIVEGDGGFIPGAEFLAKPFLPKVLVARVNQMLDR
jgi:DNA-binding response OmpR family regulator